MKNKEINKIIHEWMGGCWHEFKATSSSSDLICKKCSFTIYYKDRIYHNNPAYTSESSPRSLLAEVEGRVIEEFGISEYGKTLAGIYMDDLERLATMYDVGINATAEQRCRAIVKLIEGEK